MQDLLTGNVFLMMVLIVTTKQEMHPLKELTVNAISKRETHPIRLLPLKQPRLVVDRNSSLEMFELLVIARE